jgi:pimeloyl-ACP methyl ester carboxylesterase
MDPTKSNRLRVPGANLYYEARGSGPLLLMIAGGSGGGAGFKGIADLLASQYTVVTYDRRGFSQSTVDNPLAEVRLETHSDDAHYLLAALTAEPAYVFGSSAGALIGLDLLARYPQQVRTLVAHEPPAHHLLPDSQKSPVDALEIYRREGPLAAMRHMITETGVSHANREAGLELPHTSMQSALANAEALFKYTMPAVRGYTLNIPALKAVLTRIVIAGGSEGREYVGYRCAVAVAEHLGTTVVEFPSNHAGYISHPTAFALKLREMLEDKTAGQG